MGLVVGDLDATVRFLALLGFDCSAPSTFSGDWIGRIIGLEDVTVELQMARTPDGTDAFDVVRFQATAAGTREPEPPANRPGLRHVAFTVDDVRGVVDRVRESGWDTVGEVGEARSGSSTAQRCEAPPDGAAPWLARTVRRPPRPARRRRRCAARRAAAAGRGAGRDRG